MLSPPDDLPVDVLTALLARHWRISVARAEYRPVGFGSHHWEVADTAGARWFVTVDELETSRRRADEPVTAAFWRLRDSLATAQALRDRGCSFVVAPVPAADGEPVVLARERFGVAVYPFVEGQSFEWGEFSSAAHRDGVLDVVIAVHSAPESVRRLAGVEDYWIPLRDELEVALGSPGGGCAARVADCGPYARRAGLLLARCEAPIRELLGRYDELVAAGSAVRDVLTHGEPHPGNTMRTPEGWLLIDWDTTLVAPPERDLWSLAADNPAVLDAYAKATGVTPLPAMLELYRIKWDLTDLALGSSRFRRPHSGTPNDDEEWAILSSLAVRMGD